MWGRSGRRPGSGANVEAAASRGATRALTTAMAAPGQQGRRVTQRKSLARTAPLAPAQSPRSRPLPLAPVGGAAPAQSPGGARISPRGPGGPGCRSAPLLGRPCRWPRPSPTPARALPAPAGSGSRQQCVPRTGAGAAGQATALKRSPGNNVSAISSRKVILQQGRASVQTSESPRCPSQCLPRDPHAVLASLAGRPSACLPPLQSPPTWVPWVCRPHPCR